MTIENVEKALEAAYEEGKRDGAASVEAQLVKAREAHASVEAQLTEEREGHAERVRELHRESQELQRVAYERGRSEVEEARRAGYEEGVAAGSEAAAQESRKAHATAVAEGTVREGRCGAVAPDLTLPVTCQREAGHPLGPLDRHKAVYGEPHVAVSWNEADE